MFEKKQAPPLFKKNQKIYYPGADLSRAHIIESKITGITDDVDGSYYYNTEMSFRVPESGIKSNKNEAKKELISKIKYEQKRSAQKFKEAIESIEKSSVKELIEYGKEVQKQAAMEGMMM